MNTEFFFRPIDKPDGELGERFYFNNNSEPYEQINPDLTTDSPISSHQKSFAVQVANYSPSNSNSPGSATHSTSISPRPDHNYSPPSILNSNSPGSATHSTSISPRSDHNYSPPSILNSNSPGSATHSTSISPRPDHNYSPSSILNSNSPGSATHSTSISPRPDHNYSPPSILNSNSPGSATHSTSISPRPDHNYSPPSILNSNSPGSATHSTSISPRPNHNYSPSSILNSNSPGSATHSTSISPRPDHNYSPPSILNSNSPGSATHSTSISPRPDHNMSPVPFHMFLFDSCSSIGLPMLEAINYESNYQKALMIRVKHFAEQNFFYAALRQVQKLDSQEDQSQAYLTISTLLLEKKTDDSRNPNERNERNEIILSCALRALKSKNVTDALKITRALDLERQLEFYVRAVHERIINTSYKAGDKMPVEDYYYFFTMLDLCARIDPDTAVFLALRLPCQSQDFLYSIIVKCLSRGDSAPLLRHFNKIEDLNLCKRLLDVLIRCVEQQES